jgi:hypothetical protein
MYIGIILAMFFELYISFYSVNKGAANTDEFFILLQTKYQHNLFMFDVFNMIKIVYSSLFDSISIIAFRYAKIIFSLLTFLLSLIVLLPVLRKTYNLSFLNMLIIVHCLLSASLLSVFYRSLHYNNIMDYFSIWCVLLIIRMVECNNTVFQSIFISFLYAVAAFFLIGTKPILGCFAILAYFITIIFFCNMDSKYPKVSLAAFIMSLFMLIYVYILFFYTDISHWIHKLRIAMKIFNAYDFSLYSVDIAILIISLLLLYIYYKYNAKVPIFIIQNATVYSFCIILFVIQLILFLSLSLMNNTFSYVLYYLVPSFTLLQIILYLLLGFLIKLIILRFKEFYVFINIVFLFFFLLVLFGSQTFQLLNLILHPLPFVLIIILFALYLNKFKLINFLSGLLFICFFCYNIFNPFLYTNSTLFSQKHPFFFESSRDNIWLDIDSYNYYNKLTNLLKSYDGQYVVNVDFSNVVFNCNLKPYLISQIIDEENPVFYRNALNIFFINKKVSSKPKLLLISNPVNTKYFDIIESKCHVKIGRILFSIKDPSVNIFKFSDSNGSLNVYELLPVE